LKNPVVRTRLINRVLSAAVCDLISTAA
jgi:hypothetical protein